MVTQNVELSHIITFKYVGEKIIIKFRSIENTNILLLIPMIDKGAWMDLTERNLKELALRHIKLDMRRSF